MHEKNEAKISLLEYLYYFKGEPLEITGMGLSVQKYIFWM
jgi:hypothetical protein